jgi:hypothetical protein
MKKVKWLLLMLPLMILSACQNIYPYIDIVKDRGISDQYLAALQKWTRSQIVYSQFETRVHISATYKCSTFMKAYSAEYARIHDLEPERKQQKEQLQEELAKDYAEFFVYVYIPEIEHNDLDKPASTWTVYILDESGQRINPVEIRKFKNISPDQQAFYPYLNPYYGISYSIKFPSLEDFSQKKMGHFKMYFVSVLGKVELNW